MCENIKFQNIHRCAAFDLEASTNDYTKRCGNVSKFQYCKTHHKLLIESCEKYHFYDKQHLFKISKRFIIEAELYCREVFCKRFGIVPDLKHKCWEDKLRRILLEKIAEEKYGKNETIFVYYDLYTIKKSIYHLEIGLMLEKKIKLDELEWRNESNTEINKIDSKLSKYKKNLYLFDMFYSRNSINDINHLDCAINERFLFK